MSEDSRHVITSRFNRALCGLVWGLCAIMLVIALMESLETFLRSVAVLVLIAYAAWFALWRPSLVIGSEGLGLHNVLRSVSVPWAALIHVDTKYALTIVTPTKRYPVWVAPAPGALTSQRIARQRRRRSDDDPLRPASGTLPGELPGTASGDAAALVRAEWQARIDADLIAIGEAAATAVVIKWNVGHVAVLVGLIVVSVTAALV